MGTRRNSTELIDRLSDLAVLFEKSRDSRDFSTTTAGVIARALRADACLMFLLEENTQDLTLSGVAGITPAPPAAPATRFVANDGVPAMVLKELRPIIISRLAESPGWRELPGIPTTGYQSCLIAPIVRGLTRMGIVFLFHRKAAYFTERDIRTMRAVTASLALALENARLLMALHQIEPSKPHASHTPAISTRFIKGKPAAEGICLGTAVVHTTEIATILAAARKNNRKYKLADFQNSLRLTEEHIAQLQQ